MGKPTPAFFELALQELGIPAVQVLVVGDDPETDVAGGAAAGCRTALVASVGGGAGTTRPASVPPDQLVASLAELDF